MQKFSRIVHSIEIVQFFIALLIFSVAPHRIATHINGSGMPDAFGSRIFLFLPAVLLIIVGEVSLVTRQYRRNQQETDHLPMLFPQEWATIGVLIFLLIVFSLLIWYQSRLGQ